jgi:hypothetical protein
VDLIKEVSHMCQQNFVTTNIRANKKEATVKTESKTIMVDQRKQFKPCKETVNFPLEIEKEVKKLFPSKLFSKQSAIIMGLASTLLAEPIFAESIMGAAQSEQMSSGDFIEMFIKGAVYLNVAVMGTSICKPFVIYFLNIFNPSLAETMSTRLANGLGIALYWEMIVIAMFYLAHLILGSSPYYIDGWAIVAPHFKPAIKAVVDQFTH